MGLGILRKRILSFLGMGIALLILLGSNMNAFAVEGYPLTYDIPREKEEDCLILTKEKQNYKVEEGDCLWNIAEALWGSGVYYTELVHANRAQIADPNLIYPGMVLDISRKAYILRDPSALTYGGFQTGKYAMDQPSGWTTGVGNIGDANANFTLADNSGNMIFCLIQDKKGETVQSLKDWETCKKKITRHAEKNYPQKISDLEFDHYFMTDQEGRSGEVFLYSFHWHIFPDYDPAFSVYGCVGLKLTDHIQAEFIGCSLWEEGPIQEYTRYVTASVNELFEEKDGEPFTVNDFNMSIAPDEKWEISGMFNSFAYLDALFEGMLRDVNLEPTQEEKAMEKMSRD